MVVKHTTALTSEFKCSHGVAPWILLGIIAVVFFVVEDDIGISLRLQIEGFPRTEQVASAIAEGSLRRRVALFSLGMVAVFSLARAVFSLPRRERNPLTINGTLGFLIILFLIWAFASIAWADDVALTTRRVIVLIILSLGAIAVAEQLSFHQIIVLAFLCTGLYLLIGIGAELALGTFHPFESTYRFHGTTDRNAGALRNVILLIASVVLSSENKRFHKLFTFTGIIALTFVILSKTRTAVAAGGISLLICWILMNGSPRKILILSLTTVFLGCLMALIFGDYLVPIMRYVILLGRTDETSIRSLTGRLPVWSLCLNFIEQRPLLGYGYNSFWTPQHVTYISDRSDWGGYGVSVALNGYLDVVLGLGLVGGLIFILIIILAISRFFILYKVTRDQDYLFGFGVLVFFCLAMLLDTPTSRVGFVNFIVFILLAKLGFYEQSQKYTLRGSA